MKTGQKPIIHKILGAIVGGTMLAGMAASAGATAVTVTDVTDWNTTPMEIVNADLPYLNYNGGVYAGINSLLVTEGSSSAVFGGFCIDPFHWSLGGPIAYDMVPLADGPKSPATLNAFTAKEIGDLWAEFYSPTMTSSSAAGLQIAIWELVSSNAVATDSLPANDAFSLDGNNDYGASADIASLATYNGPGANLVALTGPGQDYVIDPPPAPDGGATCFMLALTLGGLALARPTLMKNAGQRAAAAAIPAQRPR